MDNQITITDFTPAHQPGIDLLLQEVQNEYPEVIYGSGTQKMVDVYNLPMRKYWVVMEEVVIGCIGVVILANNNACLKSMFLQKEYRGHGGIAQQLLTTAISHAAAQGARQIILGTMIQFKAAQNFYLKHGFVYMQEDELPGDFMKNFVDKVFMRLQLV